MKAEITKIEEIIKKKDEDGPEIDYSKVCAREDFDKLFE
jgi:hypothetical protein